MPTQADVLLSTQRALLGAVPASLRAVTCGWTDEKITLRFIFDGPIDGNDEEEMQVVGTEVVADFLAPMSVAEEVIRVDYPGELGPHLLRVWAYLRKERTVWATRVLPSKDRR